MAKYNITHSCGHTDTVQLYGPHRDRDRRIQWLEGKPCRACEEANLQARRETLNEAAAEEAKSLGLPDLVGTPKQVAWATTLRKQILDSYPTIVSGVIVSLITAERRQYLLDSGGRLTAEESQRLKEAFRAELLAWAANHIDASWWIDHREEYQYMVEIKSALSDVTWRLVEAIRTGKPLEASIDEVAREKAEADRLRLEAEAEATVMAEGSETNLVARIDVMRDRVRMLYPERNETVRTVARACGFDWGEHGWNMKTGSPRDRAAELGHNLLAAGINILIFDPEIRANAIAGNYKAEQTRKILRIASGDFLGWFVIKWDRKKEDWFDHAKRLPGSRWVKGEGMVVPGQSFNEILDFADLHGFELSEGAQELVEERSKIAESALRVQVETAKKDDAAAIPPKKKVPENVEIPEDLKD